jgi:hypothetical protein
VVDLDRLDSLERDEEKENVARVFRRDRVQADRNADLLSGSDIMNVIPHGGAQRDRTRAMGRRAASRRGKWRPSPVRYRTGYSQNWPNGSKS